jgi:hypothetical protein
MCKRLVRLASAKPMSAIHAFMPARTPHIVARTLHETAWGQLPLHTRSRGKCTREVC